MSMSGADIFNGGFRAVADVDLDFPANAVTALIGPTGCGESTVLRSLNHLHEPVPGSRVTGRIRLGGDDIDHPTLDPDSVRRRVRARRLPGASWAPATV